MKVCNNLIIRLFFSALPILFFVAESQAQCLRGNCKNGSGTFRYPNGSTYTGQFVNGARHGRGKLIHKNNGTYEGPFRNNKMHGDNGSMTFANGDRYIGQWTNDHPNGYGIYYFNTRERYEGQFVDGKFNGLGTMYYPDGAYYVGGWQNNLKNGQGKLIRPNGEIFEGQWVAGKLREAPKPPQANTAGASRPPSSKPDVGGMRNCNANLCRSGSGYFDYPDGSRWIGEFKDGYPNGKGICYYADGNRYEGEWAGNAPNGEGIMYFASGRVYGAVWLNGAAVKELDRRQQIPADPVIVEPGRNVRIWAVIVGVGRYTAMPSLRFTDDDAYRVYSFLKSPEGGSLPDNQIAVLVDESATRQNILRTMREYFLKADVNDVILFYFSGHGLDGCFLPFDFDGYNNRLRHDEIKQVLAQSRAKHKICIADACHSGSLTHGLAAKGPAPVSINVFYKAFEDTKGGVALLMSSKAEELSLEDHGLRQGVFTYYLLNGLRGDADYNRDNIITITELYRYVYAKVRQYTANAQTPVLTGDFDQNMPIGLRRF